MTSIRWFSQVFCASDSRLSTAPAPRLAGAENEPRYAGVDHGADAHGARFYGYVKRCSRKAVVAGLARGLPQRLDFGVSGRVARLDRPIVALSDYLPIAG